MTTNERARVSYWFDGLWLYECADPRCPVIDSAESAAAAGDEIREHMAQHHATAVPQPG